MRDLSLNILDIVENSVKAKAKLIKILLAIRDNVLTIIVEDDGCGMSKELLMNVTDPFTTTRTTRKVGMGLPLFKMAAEMTGGTMNIESEIGKGTSVKAVFHLNHIDCESIGNIGETMMTLLSNANDVDYYLEYTVDQNRFCFDTREVKKELGSISITDSNVLIFVKDMINENINFINGGRIV